MSCVDPTRLTITKHASQRLAERRIIIEDIKEVARNHAVAYTGQNGRSIRAGLLADGQRLQVVFEKNAAGWDVVTAYYKES